jgi:hypothetical protein
MAIYFNCGSKEAIEYIPLLSALNFAGCETQSLIKLDIVLSYCTHSFYLNFSKNSTSYVRSDTVGNLYIACNCSGLKVSMVTLCSLMTVLVGMSTWSNAYQTIS